MAGSVLNGVRSDTPPEVSVLMCVYNGENYVTEAIDSILGQSDVRFELVIVDDCSTDDSMFLLEGYGDNVSVIAKSENSGLGPSRNAGVENSSGEFLVFADHDDILPPGSLVMRRRGFDERDGIDMVSGAVDEFVPAELIEKLTKEGVRPRSGIAGSVTSVMVKREAFDRVGPFENLPHAACMNWRMRAQELGLDTLHTDQVVYRRRLHETNSSRQGGSAQPGLRFEAIRRARAARGVGGR